MKRVFDNLPIDGTKKVLPTSLDDFSNVIESIRQGREILPLYRVFPLDLSIARTDDPVNLAGNILTIISATDATSTISVKVNENRNDLIPLVKGDRYKTPFYRFYITNAAQPGKVASLAAGVDSDFWELIQCCPTGGNGVGAPVDASYVVFAANAVLTNEKLLGADTIMQGTLAARPAPATDGRLYYVTDAGIQRWTRDNGAAWEDRGPHWDFVNGKPVTFPPTVPIGEADITFNGAGHDHTGGAAGNVIPTAGIEDQAVTLAKMQNIATLRALGRITAGVGIIEELTAAQITTLIDIFTAALKGSVPASGGGTTNFLRADGTWAAPGGGGAPGGPEGSVQFNVGGVFTGEAAFNYDTALNRLLLDILECPEIAVPAAAVANRLRKYAFDNGAGAQARTIDEFGLIDILSQRDRRRSRKDFLICQGSDTMSGATDFACIGIVAAAAEGTIANTTGNADGQRKNFLTGAVLDADSGILGVFNQTQRDFNPDVTIKFKINSSAVRRVWIGWMESDHMGSDSSAAIHKFALRVSTSPAVTGFTIVHSDGTTETVEAQIQAADTAIHTIRLIADNANARWGYSFDGAAVVWITTNIPAATALMGLQIQIRTLEAVAKNMDFWFAEGSMEK